MVLTAIILAAFVAIAVGWPWRAEPPPRSVADSSSASSEIGRALMARYVGEAACLECHPGESALHRRSGHARTLRLAERSPIIAWLDGRSVSDPKHPGVRWSYRVRDDRLVVERAEGDSTGALALDYAVGSGKHGVTFVSVRQPRGEAVLRGIEHRLSYVIDGPRLEITPGQERSPPIRPVGETGEGAGFGRMLGPDGLRQCLACHATAISPAFQGRDDTANLLPNVSCERCHGPGRDHVDAARRGQTELSLRVVAEGAPPWAEVNRCGECHRLPNMVSSSSIRPDNPGIVRFQGVGLSMSACYAQGVGSLRCTSCHDPHDRASRDQARYEVVCLSCHRSASARKACPVSPAGDCIGCHMPRREIPGNGTFTDHWIRKSDARGPQRDVGRPAAARSSASRSASVPPRG